MKFLRNFISFIIFPISIYLVKLEKKSEELVAFNNKLTNTDPNQVPPQVPQQGQIPNQGQATNIPGQPGQIQLLGPLMQKLADNQKSDTTQSIRNSLRKWDLKLTDKQLEDISVDMMKGEHTVATPEAKTSFLQFFVNLFTYCDTSKNNVLEYPEFELCMKNDTYLIAFQPPPEKYSAYREHSIYNATGYYSMIFNLLDSQKDNVLNFYEYMQLRLFAFSWKKCSVSAPFIDEVSFECAINISSGFRTLSRATYKRLYFMASEIADNENVRNIDFITYITVASSARLYSKLNTMTDSDLSRQELTLGLDSNILPTRYGADIIENLYKLVSEADKPNQGLDIVSFAFYDFFLMLFDTPSVTRKHHLNFDEYYKIIENYLFPNRTRSEIEMVPQNELTPTSLNQHTYVNIPHYSNEGDHFMKAYASFLEKDNLLTLTATSTNLKFNAKRTYNDIFNIIDSDGDGWINFYDYGQFIQVAYIFSIFDKFNKGRIVAADLQEKLTNYFDFPVISDSLRNKARRLSYLPQDLYVDVKSALFILRLDDFAESLVRKSDRSTIYEYELKNVLASVGMKYIPDKILNGCLRPVDMNNIPTYDWECSFMKAITETLRYYESSYALIQTRAKGFTMENTIFSNIDPNIA
jgi:hypothetical protein